MQTTAGLDTATRATLATRLKSIEGQARGLQRMLDEERPCQEIMDQFLALRAASQAATMQALDAFARHCLAAAEGAPERAVQDLVAMVARLTR
jgi:DNA-binding FrmR family transcriptional regulator